MKTLDVGPFDERQKFEVTDGEGQRLAWLASEAKQGTSIVEVGSYRGRSTCYLAAGSREGPNIPIVAVDLWTDHPDHLLKAKGRKVAAVYNKPENKEGFVERVERFGFTDLVKSIQGDSRAVAREWRKGPRIGLLFVDGSHTKKDVIRDFNAWVTYMPIGARVVFHDYHLKRVREGIKQVLKDHSDWRFGGSYEKLYMIEKTK